MPLLFFMGRLLHDRQTPNPIVATPCTYPATKEKMYVRHLDSVVSYIFFSTPQVSSFH